MCSVGFRCLAPQQNMAAYGAEYDVVVLARRVHFVHPCKSASTTVTIRTLSVRGTFGRSSTSSLEYLTRIHAALSQTLSSGDFGHSMWGFGDAVPPRICEKFRLFVAFFIPRVINCESLGFRRTHRLRVLFREGETEGAAYLNKYRYHFRESLR